MIELNHKWLAIIAGGQGTRLFPYSHPERPKQFCQLNEQDTFIQAVIRNFGSLGDVIPKTHIVVITTNETQTKLAREQTIPRGVLSQNIHQIDPSYDFAGAMVKATEFIYALDPQAVIISTPSDQYVNADAAFCDTITKAINEAEQGSPTIVGVKVNDLAMAMGCGHAIYDDSNSSSECFPVKKFVEKPSDEKIADQIMRAGDSACNTGITVWQTKHICEELANRLSVSLDEFARGLKTDRLMEQFDNLKIAVGEFDWRDCGTLESLHEISKKTPNHRNASLGGGHIERYKCLDGLFLCDPGYSLYTTNCRGVAVVFTTIDNRPTVAVIDKKESTRVKELAEDFARNRDLLVNDFAIQARDNIVPPSNMSEESVVCFVCVNGYTVNIFRSSGDTINALVSGPIAP